MGLESRASLGPWRHPGVILAIVSTGLFTAIALGLVGAYWAGSPRGRPFAALEGAQEAEGKADQGRERGLCGMAFGSWQVVDESVMSKEKDWECDSGEVRAATCQRLRTG